MNENQITAWLREKDPDRLTELFRQADSVRREHVGDAVHLRGLVELSNICRRNCLYCGVRAGHDTIGRYRLTAEEVMHGAALASQFGYGTLVLQAGEDFGLSAEFVADLIRGIKEKYHLAVTLSLGERTESDWRLWREAGADRYLIRFETCNRALFEVIHPPVGKNDTGFEGRIGALRVSGARASGIDKATIVKAALAIAGTAVAGIIAGKAMKSTISWLKKLM